MTTNNIQARSLVQARAEMEHTSSGLGSYQRPNISLRDSLRARFTWRGQSYVVASCPVGILRESLVDACREAQLRPSHISVIEECLGLDCDDLARWHAVDLALTDGARWEHTTD